LSIVQRSPWFWLVQTWGKLSILTWIAGTSVTSSAPKRTILRISKFRSEISRLPAATQPRLYILPALYRQRNGQNIKDTVPRGSTLSSPYQAAPKKFCHEASSGHSNLHGNACSASLHLCDIISPYTCSHSFYMHADILEIAAALPESSDESRTARSAAYL
jgi:hypothetical protein